MEIGNYTTTESMLMKDNWTTDWDRFTRLVEHRARTDGCFDVLNNAISGKQIQWRGVLIAVDIDDLLAVVRVMLPAYQFNWPEGGGLQQLEELASRLRRVLPPSGSTCP